MDTQTNCITLQGSAQTVVEYLSYGINSILFQRGLYPPEDFTPQEHFGITMLMSKNEKVKEFLARVLRKVQDWLPDRKVEKVSLVIFDVKTKKAIERWDFTIKPEDVVDFDENLGLISTKKMSTVQAEICNVMRQITATISFLPLIHDAATFDVMVHPNMSKFADHAPNEWQWTKAHDISIQNAQSVQLRSISTGFDAVETKILFKPDKE